MQLTANEVLHIFHRDEISLFLGAAFATVGLVSFGLLIIRRKFDALLFWLALFAILYGGRLWMHTDLMLLMVPPSDFFDRLKAAADFTVAIPAFFFFKATGFLGRLGDFVAYIAGSLLLLLLLAAVGGAPLTRLYQANSIIVISALMLLIVQTFRAPIRTKDFLVIRSGLLIFIGFALWNNINNLLGFHPGIEKYGFAIFLACLGYAAARHLLERDQQLDEIQKELDVAKRIQLSILPGEFPASANFRVAARYVPMRSVAGDFYDFLIADDKQAGLLIADVSGHGIPAALIASMVKLAASSQRAAVHNPSELLTAMNSTLCGNTQNQFVTAAYVHLDAERRELRYAAAAHPPMLLLRNGRVMQIEENGLMLALFPSASYTSAVQALQPGDRVVLYTDGIIEAADTSENQFGLERLANLLRESAGYTHMEVVDHIMTSIQNWAATQEDDLTAIVCDFVGVTQV
ncbi:MAG TPA: PP2C family protein-serine/threonine phosphatase [Pseudacidobacterium sp.]|jgi:sigma-B regulation protein RsbU (phosphoserine phosphatase)|nr:PP2C family protein-serine/threonine phosphatase [Pseudacidobacterium sp.]